MYVYCETQGNTHGSQKGRNEKKRITKTNIPRYELVVQEDSQDIICLF